MTTMELFDWEDLTHYRMLCVLAENVYTIFLDAHKYKNLNIDPVWKDHKWTGLCTHASFSESIREAMSKEYIKAKNSERCREWRDGREKLLAEKREWGQKNSERLRALASARYYANRDAINEERRQQWAAMTVEGMYIVPISALKANINAEREELYVKRHDKYEQQKLDRSPEEAAAHLAHAIELQTARRANWTPEQRESHNTAARIRQQVKVENMDPAEKQAFKAHKREVERARLKRHREQLSPEELEAERKVRRMKRRKGANA
ncbi:hypothetical protein UCRPA7_3436 [Phaeoacremonium minimum UCRPA7]|uniref:Uncharacterized protein n=1 Tax=Phaeoacremonium minimum (strain UCR-PA7) TaxID=1286976 RepID=R8BNX2_PHAM7|nr:hypothetical protein UCRPA7_3436 [Phaeoacremonium minimum UCRPA7]EOO01098.1 hypothetical protein UCRPA7_3436 [Phaeoacremonium minimum UCRPA7]